MEKLEALTPLVRTPMTVGRLVKFESLISLTSSGSTTSASLSEYMLHFHGDSDVGMYARVVHGPCARLTTGGRSPHRLDTVVLYSTTVAGEAQGPFNGTRLDTVVLYHYGRQRGAGSVQWNEARYSSALLN